MLQLSSRGAHRIGTSYICASCLRTCPSPRLRVHHPTLLPYPHSRTLSTTPFRLAPAIEPATDRADSPLPDPPKKKGKKKKSEKNAEAQSVSKKGSIKTDEARQIQVLEGALRALKNVLASQNINVEQMSKPSGQSASQASESQPTTQNASETNDEDVKPARKAAGKTKSKKAAAAAAADSVTETHETNEEATEKRDEAKAKKLSSKAKEKRKKETKAATKAKSKKGKSKKAATTTTTTTTTTTKKKRKPKEDEEDVEETPLYINTINPLELHLHPVDAPRPPVPSLSYGLDRVLFNPGVYTVQDPRSRVYNFDPYLSEIMPIQEFDFNALQRYVTSSKDNNLIRIAKEQGKKYTGSTSSMTSMLSHFHYLLSSWREINTTMLSRSLVPDSVQFTRIMRGPAAIFLHWKDGTYAIDADKEFDTANILSMLGKSMEKLLTLSREGYERYRHVNSDQITEEERNADEAFHYTGFRDFMMRSQLDAYDPRVPGTGMFDLKTRAVVSIRMDAKGFHKGLGYEIRSRFGQWASFEREYYDMIRSAFLKYSLQVRMGRMDGIFVAFHNTQRIFGFQYIPLVEMDLALHGTCHRMTGDQEYKISLALLNDVLDRATKKFPEQSLRLHFETRTSVSAPFMYVFAKPVSQEDIDEVQNATKASIEAFERDILGLAEADAEAEAESIASSAKELAEEEESAEAEERMEQACEVQAQACEIQDQDTTSLSAWEEVLQMVEDAVDDDEIGVGAVREAIEDALEQSGLLHATSSTDARGHVDALLNAIVTGSKPPRPIESSSSSPEDHTQQVEEPTEEPTESTGELAEERTEDVQKAQDVTEETREHSSEVSTAPENGQGNLAPDSDASASVGRSTSQEQANPTPSREVEEDEEEEEDEENEEDEEEDDDEDDEDDGDAEPEAGEPKRAPSTAPRMSSLKDLIVSMAQRIDERSVSDEMRSPADDSSKLKEFERILGQLIARSKDERTRLPTNNVGQASETQTEPETQDGAEATMSETGEAGAQDSSESQESSSATSGESNTETKEEVVPDLLGMVVTIRNKVNGQYVARPEDLKGSDHWVVEYNIEEIASPRVQTIYQQCQTRRRKLFQDTGDKEAEWYKMFCGNLDLHTNAGREFRRNELKRAKNSPVHVYGLDKPLTWEEAFGRKAETTEEEANSLKELERWFEEYYKL